MKSAPLPDIRFKNRHTENIKDKILEKCKFYTPKDFYNTFASNSILTRQGQRVYSVVNQDNDQNYNEEYTKPDEKKYTINDSTPYSTISNNFAFFNRPRINKYGSFMAPFLGYGFDSRLNTPVSATFMETVNQLNRTTIWNSPIHHSMANAKANIDIHVNKVLGLPDPENYEKHHKFSRAILANSGILLEKDRRYETDMLTSPEFAKQERAYMRKQLMEKVTDSRFTPNLELISSDMLGYKWTGNNVIDIDPWCAFEKFLMLAYIADMLGAEGIREVLTKEEISLDNLANKPDTYGWDENNISSENGFDIPAEKKDNFVFVPSFTYDPEAEKCETFNPENVTWEKMEAIAALPEEEREKAVAETFETDNFTQIALKDEKLRKNLYEKRTPILTLGKTGYEAMGLDKTDYLSAEAKMGLNVLLRNPKNTYSTDLLASSGIEGYTDLKDNYLYLDALRFTNTVSRNKEEFEQRQVEEAALKKIGRLDAEELER